MASVRFILPDGTEKVVEALAGTSLMELAVRASIPGIAADCGGAMSCGTCHVWVDRAWMGSLPSPSQMEGDMLDFVVDRRETSRLACQINYAEGLDGLVVCVPEAPF